MQSGFELLSINHTTQLQCSVWATRHLDEMSSAKSLSTYQLLYNDL